MWSVSTSHRSGGARIEEGAMIDARMDRKIGGVMRIPLLIGSIVLSGACAGASTRPYADEGVEGRWQGVVLRNGLRAPVAVELSAQDRDWRGRFSAGDNSVALQDVRVTAN